MDLGEYDIIVNMTTAENKDIIKLFSEENITILGLIAKPAQMFEKLNKTMSISMILDDNDDQIYQTAENLIKNINLIEIKYIKINANKSINRDTTNKARVVIDDLSQINEALIKDNSRDIVDIVLPNIRIGEYNYIRHAQIAYWRAMKYNVVCATEQETIEYTKRIMKYLASIIKEIYEKINTTSAETTNKNREYNARFMSNTKNKNNYWYYNGEKVVNIMGIEIKNNANTKNID